MHACSSVNEVIVLEKYTIPLSKDAGIKTEELLTLKSLKNYFARRSFTSDPFPDGWAFRNPSSGPWNPEGPILERFRDQPIPFARWEGQ